MVDPIIRQKVRGKSMPNPYRLYWPTPGWQVDRHRKKRISDQARPPPGPKPDIVKIRTGHRSYKPLQDYIEERMKKSIRKEIQGSPRQRELIEDLEAWIQNGRPTWGDIPSHIKKEIHEHNRSRSEQTYWREMLIKRGETTAVEDIKDGKKTKITRRDLEI